MKKKKLKIHEITECSKCRKPLDIGFEVRGLEDYRYLCDRCDMRSMAGKPGLPKRAAKPVSAEAGARWVSAEEYKRHMAGGRGG